MCCISSCSFQACRRCQVVSGYCRLLSSKRGNIRLLRDAASQKARFQFPRFLGRRFDLGPNVAVNYEIAAVLVRDATHHRLSSHAVVCFAVAFAKITKILDAALLAVTTSTLGSYPVLLVPAGTLCSGWCKSEITSSKHHLQHRGSQLKLAARWCKL